MKVWYDTEFIDDGRTIDLISIGMVNELGEGLYLINRGIGLRRIYEHHWLRQNVLPHLPVTYVSGAPVWADDHPDTPSVRSKADIASAVRRFLIGGLRPLPELWAWYGAYDHVALAQLWGPMAKLPDGIPMWTNDLRQVLHMAGSTDDLELPPQVNVHRAIDDARWNRLVHGRFVELGLIKE